MRELVSGARRYKLQRKIYKRQKKKSQGPLYELAMVSILCVRYLLDLSCPMSESIFFLMDDYITSP